MVAASVETTKGSKNMGNKSKKEAKQVEIPVEPETTAEATPAEGKKKRGRPPAKEKTEIAAVPVVQVSPEVMKEKAILRSRILDLRKQVEEGYWDLSAGLWEVYDQGIFTMWGFGSWKDYVEQELDFQIRKAQYLVQIHDWFKAMSQGTQDWVKSLGWTKAKELVGIVTDANVDEWKERVAGKNSRQLAEEVHKAGESGEGGSADPGADAGGEEKPVRKGFSLFVSQMENVNLAIEKAKEIGNTEKEGHALDLICTEFIAQNAGLEDLNGYLAKIEKITGVGLIAYDFKEKEIVFGDNLLENLTQDDSDGSGEQA